MKFLPEQGMTYAYYGTNDNISLAYQTSLPLPASGPGSASASDPRRTSRQVILLLHGFSGSSTYFKHNFAALSKKYWVVALDLRGHGASGSDKGGWHVARMAMDVKELIACLEGQVEAAEAFAVSSSSSSISLSPMTAQKAGEDQGTEGGVGVKAQSSSGSDVNLNKPTKGKERPLQILGIGCSLGAAILWTYNELFTTSPFAGFIFVDQAPLQDLSPFPCSLASSKWDVSLAHKGCFNEASMRAAQETWINDPEAAYKGLVEGCLGPESFRPKSTGNDGQGRETREEAEQFFIRISRRCNSTWLARLLEDHTRYDHRESLGLMDVPTVVMAGKGAQCFPVEGIKATVGMVNEGWKRRRVLKGEKDEEGDEEEKELASWSLYECGHWLFYEEPERFNREVLEFADRCFGK